MLYLVFVAAAAVLVAGALFLVRRHHQEDPSRSVDSFRRRLRALDQQGHR
ncbi:MAG TPA: hypothetical protein VHA57_06975 [Actinomycetota bacterium]|nr:hypothetical protein [Actinomycetota bacterium]